MDHVRAKPDEFTKLVSIGRTDMKRHQLIPVVSTGRVKILTAKLAIGASGQMIIRERGDGISENEIRVSSKNSEDQQKRGKSVSAVLEQLADGIREQTNRINIPRDTQSFGGKSSASYY